MSSTQSPSSPKIYLRNSVYSTNEEPIIQSPSYGNQAQIGDATVYIRQPVQQMQQSPASLLSPPDNSSMRCTSPFSEVSNDSRYMNARCPRNHRSGSRHHHRSKNRQPRIEEPDGYWILPHAGTRPVRSNAPLPPYVTPGGRQFSRMPRTHTAGVQVAGADQSSIGGDVFSNTSMANVIDIETDDYMQSSEYLPSDDPEISVSSFRKQRRHEYFVFRFICSKNADTRFL